MMKRLVNLLAAFILSVNCISAQNLTRWVNPFIGTVPFGMVQLSPDTREAPDWAQASGYDYNDSIIYGFSHTRLSGTGASDFIDILLFPTISDKRKSTFTHQHEQARPGYYQVLLKDEKIQAELTASVHVGVHRYTCSDGDQLKLWLDLDHSANKGSWNFPNRSYPISYMMAIGCMRILLSLMVRNCVDCFASIRSGIKN